MKVNIWALAFMAFVTFNAAACRKANNSTSGPQRGPKIAASAVISKSAKVHESVQISEQVQVRDSANINKDVVLKERVIIEAGVWLEEGVTVDAGTRLGAGVHIGAHSALGKNCEVGPDSSIGRHSVIGDAVKLLGSWAVPACIRLSSHNGAFHVAFRMEPKLVDACAEQIAKEMLMAALQVPTMGALREKTTAVKELMLAGRSDPNLESRASRLANCGVYKQGAHNASECLRD